MKSWTNDDNYHRLKIFLTFYGSLWINQSSIIDSYGCYGTGRLRTLEEIDGPSWPCQALQRHLLQSLGLWSSAVPFLHGLDAGHRRLPRTRLRWSQEWRDDWWPWILYPGGYPGCLTQGYPDVLRCTFQNGKSNLSFRFIEFIHRGGNDI